MPSFKYNLIAISSLTSHIKGVVLFSNIVCLLQAPSLKRPLEIGNVHDGLYLLCSNCLRKGTNISESESCFSNSVFPSKSNLVDKMHCSYYSISHSCKFSNVNNMFSINKDSVSSSSYNVASHNDNVHLLWHYRLGHVPFVKMKGMPIPVNFSPKQPFFCSICPMARQVRLPFPDKTTTSSSAIFELVHVDLWGPYHVATHNNYKYFLTLVDDCHAPFFSKQTFLSDARPNNSFGF